MASHEARRTERTTGTRLAVACAINRPEPLMHPEGVSGTAMILSCRWDPRVGRHRRDLPCILDVRIRRLPCRLQQARRAETCNSARPPTQETRHSDGRLIPSAFWCGAAFCCPNVVKNARISGKKWRFIRLYRYFPSKCCMSGIIEQ